MDALRGIGFSQSTGFGPVPLPWQEIVAYAQATGEISEPWEFRALSGMSRTYCAGLRLGENVWAKFPWHEDND